MINFFDSIPLYPGWLFLFFLGLFFIKLTKYRKAGKAIIILFSIPILLTGGTLDLITPPLQEQLTLLISATKHPFSRALIIEGASHFSPVRVEDQFNKDSRDDLFQLGEVFVGVQPLLVQKVLAKEIINFLYSLENNVEPSPSVHKQSGDLRVHLLDRIAIENLINNQ